MSIHKNYLKGKPVCRITFEIPAELANGVKKVFLVGDFNSWSQSAHFMKRRKDGVFATTVDLEKGKEYQFRYLLDGGIWANELQADRSVPSPYGDSENSVITL